jgi:hypothetical protein
MAEGKPKRKTWYEYPPDERDYQLAVESGADRDGGKVIQESVTPTRAISNLNASSPISRVIHDGMMKRPKHVDKNTVFAPTGMVGVREERSVLVKKEPLVANESPDVSRELRVARKQIEIDEQEKEDLKETIKKLRKKIKELEARPIVTEEMQLELAAYHRAKRKSRERERRFIEKHSKE